MDELVVKDLIDRLIDLSFAEDIGDGDHTTLSCIPADAMGKSKLLIKEEGILAGIEVAKEVFRRFDPTMKVEVFIQDGTHVKPGDVAMVVEGKVQSLLQTERLMLNIMQRMSGIATMTNKYVKKLEGTKTRVLDTRKTTPGMRIMEKMAVSSSPDIWAVSMPCSSKQTPIPRSLSSRTAIRLSLVFRANRAVDFVRTLSMRPLRQSFRSRWKSSRFSAEVPVIPSSAYTSTNSHSGLPVMSSV